MSDAKHCRFLVIGSGPAGYTAAIYGARANLRPVLITGLEQGGQLTTTTEVENYPGFPDGIMGPDLMEQMRKQAERFGSRHEFKIVDGVDFAGRPLKLIVGDETIETRAVGEELLPDDLHVVRGFLGHGGRRQHPYADQQTD